MRPAEACLHPVEIGASRELARRATVRVSLRLYRGVHAMIDRTPCPTRHAGEERE